MRAEERPDWRRQQPEIQVGETTQRLTASGAEPCPGTADVTSPRQLAHCRRFYENWAVRDLGCQQAHGAIPVYTPISSESSASAKNTRRIWALTRGNHLRWPSKSWTVLNLTPAVHRDVEQDRYRSTPASQCDASFTTKSRLAVNTFWRGAVAESIAAKIAPPCGSCPEAGSFAISETLHRYRP